MKFIQHLFSLISMLLIISCSSTEETESKNGDIPSEKKPGFHKPPLQIELMDTAVINGEIELIFAAEHEYGLPAAGDDFHYSFPEYIFDTENIPYKLTNIEISPAADVKNGEQILIRLQLSPAPYEKDTILTVPLKIFPAVFEDGYVFRMEEKSPGTITAGELKMRDITADKKTITFLLTDSHPEKKSRNLSYSYRMVKDGNNVYPVHTSSKITGRGTFIELTFAIPVSYPAEIIIDRTSAYVPEWNTVFHVPLSDSSP